MTRIVLVEDEAHIREDIVEELTDVGHEVIAVTNGREGLQAILRHRPDLVICDCLMPVMTGAELLGALRRDYPEFDDMPFVFLSAHADKTHVEDGLAIGADLYLVKPIDFDLLIESVEALLERNRSR